METDIRLSSPRVWLLSAAFWFAFLQLQYVASLPFQPEAISWRLAGIFLLAALPYVVATPLLFAVAPRLIRGDRTARQRVWIALGVVSGTGVLHAVYTNLTNSPGERLLLEGIAAHVPVTLLQHAGLLGIGTALAYQRHVLRREGDLVAARLRALRAHLQPHFLFNTLQAIGVAARTDGAAAARMVALLGDLLRQTLRERSEPLVRLAEERDLLQPYLDLQQIRFADRLRVDVDIAADVLDAAVPDLVLQPLVENALQHGIERRPGAGSLRIFAHRSGGELVVEVRDDGAGPGAASDVQGTGTGLATTRERLQTLFGGAAAVTLAPAAGGGTVATLRLPFREVPRAA
jgi:hypothetical protein